MSRGLATVAQEATISKIGKAQIFYCNQRSLPTDGAASKRVSGVCKDMFRKFPMEFAIEV